MRVLILLVIEVLIFASDRGADCASDGGADLLQ